MQMRQWRMTPTKCNHRYRIGTEALGDLSHVHQKTGEDHKIVFRRWVLIRNHLAMGLDKGGVMKVEQKANWLTAVTSPTP